MLTLFFCVSLVVSSDRLKFAHCPIVDCGVTDDDRVLSLCRELVKDITEGEVIYLHCWGGHGRTGTVVCIMLHIMYGVRDQSGRLKTYFFILISI